MVAARLGRLLHHAGVEDGREGPEARGARGGENAGERAPLPRWRDAPTAGGAAGVRAPAGPEGRARRLPAPVSEGPGAESSPPGRPEARPTLRLRAEEVGEGAGVERREPRETGRARPFRARTGEKGRCRFGTCLSTTVKEGTVAGGTGWGEGQESGPPSRRAPRDAAGLGGPRAPDGRLGPRPGRSRGRAWGSAGAGLPAPDARREGGRGLSPDLQGGAWVVDRTLPLPRPLPDRRGSLPPLSPPPPVWAPAVGGHSYLLRRGPAGPPPPPGRPASSPLGSSGAGDPSPGGCPSLDLPSTPPGGKCR